MTKMTKWLKEAVRTTPMSKEVMKGIPQLEGKSRRNFPDFTSHSMKKRTQRSLNLEPAEQDFHPAEQDFYPEEQDFYLKDHQFPLSMYFEQNAFIHLRSDSNWDLRFNYSLRCTGVSVASREWWPDQWRSSGTQWLNDRERNDVWSFLHCSVLPSIRLVKKFCKKRRADRRVERERVDICAVVRAQPAVQRVVGYLDALYDHRGNRIPVCRLETAGSRSTDLSGGRQLGKEVPEFSE